jgi:rfaE bifunctional protein nucleotidyltransferase chain/domain
MMSRNNSNSKIINFEELIVLVNKLKQSGKTIALCHGVFDLLHPGHITHFQQASEYADFLFVSITSDKYVNKGPGRPLFPEDIRAHSLSAIESVDAIVITNNPTAEEIIKLIQPNFYVKGSDYEDEKSDVTGKIKLERTVVENFGGKLIFTTGITSSSSKLINTHFSNLDRNSQLWIKKFKQIGGFEKVANSLEKIAKLKPLILGETILDRYTFCVPLAKSSKDPILAFQINDSYFYPGGVLAIANNCSSWSEKVGVISFLSEDAELSYLLKEKLNNNIEYHFIYPKDRPTILKHRYVESGSNVRIFEYYDFSDLELTLIDSTAVEQNIAEKFSEYDLLIVADYGHGFFTKSTISLLESLPTFISINTQSNAGNRGYNTISKYSRAEMLTFNGAELQLELRNRNPDYLKIVPEIMSQKKSSHAVVTLGADGLIVFDSQGNFEKVPAFANKLVDKVGAGDSVFAMASLLSKINAPLEVIGFLSNLVAAHEVSQLGHNISLKSEDLLKQSKAILG